MNLENALSEFQRYEAFQAKYRAYTSNEGIYEKKENAKKRKGKAKDKMTPSQQELQRFLHFWLFPTKEAQEERKKECGRIVVAQDEGLEFVYSWQPPSGNADAGQSSSVSKKGATRKKDNSTYTFELKWKTDASTIQSSKRQANGHEDLLYRWVTRANGEKLRKLCMLTIFAIALQIKAESTDLDVVKWHGIDIRYKTPEQVNQTLAQLEKKMIGNQRVTKKSFAAHESVTIDCHRLIKQLRAVRSEESYKEMVEAWPISFESSDVKAAFETEMRSVRYEVYERIGNEIIKAASKLPVLSESIKTVHGSGADERNENIRSLLQALCTIKLECSTNGGYTPVITIRPIVAGSLEIFDRLYSTERLWNKFYTRQDVLHIFGRVAYELSRCTDSKYKISKEKLYQTFKFPETDIPMFEQILQTAVQAEKEKSAESGVCADKQQKVLRLIEEAKNKKAEISYRFKYKQLRLVFLGIHYAMLAQHDRKIDEALAKVFNVKHQLPKNHTHWNFDEIAIVGASMLTASSYFDRRTMLEKLQEMARDHSAENREKQQIALHILSYYLIEGPQVTHKMRMDIFKTCFAQDSYELQDNMWKYLKQIPAYKSAVQDAFDAVFVEPAASETTAEAQYFFLWWSLRQSLYGPEDPRTVLLYACQCQHASWHGGDVAKKWKYEDVMQVIRNAVGKIKALCLVTDDSRQYDHRLVRYVFALNALLYSMANMTLVRTNAHIACAAEIEKKAINGFDREHMQEAVIICDYWTRRTCGSYQNALEAENSDTAIYMLSGAVRFICAYRPAWKPFAISCEQKDFYCKCFDAEKSRRFKYLLLRVVALTDRLNSLVSPDADLTDYEQATFLAYDNMPQSWQDFKAELFGRNTERR